MDPFTIAAALVGILAPLLRTFGEAAADRAARKAGEAIGDTALRGAGSLWHKIAPALHQQPDADLAIKDLAADPDRQPARTVLGGRIAFLLDGDPVLLREATAVIDARDRYVASTIQIRGNRNVVQSGDGNISVHGGKDVRIKRS